MDWVEKYVLDYKLLLLIPWVSPVTSGVNSIMIIDRFVVIHVKQTQCKWIWEKKRDTSIKMQDKSSKNGFETHTNTKEEENFHLGLWAVPFWNLFGFRGAIKICDDLLLKLSGFAPVIHTQAQQCRMA